VKQIFEVLAKNEEVVETSPFWLKIPNSPSYLGQIAIVKRMKLQSFFSLVVVPLKESAIRNKNVGGYG
jgi:hypothetical protein